MPSTAVLADIQTRWLTTRGRQIGQPDTGTWVCLPSFRVSRHSAPARRRPETGLRHLDYNDDAEAKGNDHPNVGGRRHGDPEGIPDRWKLHQYNDQSQFPADGDQEPL